MYRDHTFLVSIDYILVHNLCLTKGKNFKAHYLPGKRTKGKMSKKELMENYLNKEYPKYKEDEGAEFLRDLGNLIENGTVKFVGRATVNAGTPGVHNVFRGNGLTIITKGEREYVTVLKSGEGRDLGFQFLDDVPVP